MPLMSLDPLQIKAKNYVLKKGLDKKYDKWNKSKSWQKINHEYLVYSFSYKGEVYVGSSFNMGGRISVHRSRFKDALNGYYAYPVYKKLVELGCKDLSEVELNFHPNKHEYDLIEEIGTLNTQKYYE